MHVVRYSRYPNNEIRCTHYYRANPKERPLDEAGNFLVPQDIRASVPEEREPALASVPTLDISEDFGRRGVSNPHKRTKFGANAKNTILRMGGALDTVDTEPSNYLFLTGTLPGGTHDAFMAIAIESPYVVKSIADWLRCTAPADYWFYVWELQDRGALHIHYCLHVPNTAIRNKVLQEWKPKWHSILTAIQDKTGIDVFQRADGTHHADVYGVLQAYAQQVHKSVAAYMAGYCSGIKDKHGKDAVSPYYPKRWWGASRKLTNLLKGLTEEVVVEHSGYREARNEIQVHYERVLHDSPKAHHYPHKVGIGSTCVSYHPEDKGHEIWHRLKPMLYNKTHYPNTASTIALYRELVCQTTCLLETSPEQIRNLFRPLLLTLRDCTFTVPDYGYSIAQRDMRVIQSVPSDLSSALCTLPGWERLRMQWCLLKDSAQAILPKLTWDRFTNLSTTQDIFCLLDIHWSKGYLSTTEPKGTEALSGAAHGSMSPQNPASLQMTLPCFSDS